MSETLPSLLDAQDLMPVPAPAPEPVSRRVRAWARARWERFWIPISQDPKRRKRWVLGARIGAAAGAMAIGVGAYFAFRPVPMPDYATDNLDDVLGYTLLTDEFNKLPIKKRLELIAALVGRLKDMSAGDSVLMASFAAGIAGAAREQMMENASRLAVDVW